MDLVFKTADEVVLHLKEKGYVVRTQQEDESFLEAESKKKIGEAVGKMLKGIDDKVAATIGGNRPEGTMTSDWIVNNITQHKEKIKGLEDQLKAGGKAPEELEALKAQLTSVQANLKEKNDELEKVLKKHSEEKFTTRFNMEIDSYLETLNGKLIKLPNDTEGNLIKSLIGAKKREFLDRYRPVEIEGIIGYKDTKDNLNVVTSKQDGVMLTTSKLMPTFFEALIDKSVANPPAGAGAPMGTGVPNPGQYMPNGQGAPASDPNKLDLKALGIGSKVQLSRHILAMGHKSGTKEFGDIYSANSSELPLK